VPSRGWVAGQAGAGLGAPVSWGSPCEPRSSLSWGQPQGWAKPAGTPHSQACPALQGPAGRGAVGGGGLTDRSPRGLCGQPPFDNGHLSPHPVSETPGARCLVGRWLSQVLGELALGASEKHLFPRPSWRTAFSGRGSQTLFPCLSAFMQLETPGSVGSQGTVPRPAHSSPGHSWPH